MNYFNFWAISQVRIIFHFDFSLFLSAKTETTISPTLPLVKFRGSGVNYSIVGNKEASLNAMKKDFIYY